MATSKNFDEAMKKLAEEARRGVAKDKPMTAQQKKAIERATERLAQQEQKAEARKRQLDRDQGHDVDM